VKRLLVVFGLLCLVDLTHAEEAVYFADPNLKLCVEKALRVSDPAPEDMLALTELTCALRGVSDITGIEYAVNLRKLRLSYNHIRNVAPLSGLNNLRELWLNVNEIDELSPLSSLTRLETLILHRNPIRDISPLSTLTNLQSLDLLATQISDISTLSRLTNLTYLDLSHNNVSDISVLSRFVNLQRLLIMHCQISDVSPLSALDHLEMLYLNANSIHDISPLLGLTRLRTLYLSDNELNDDADCEHLQRIIENNPGIDLRYSPTRVPPAGLSASDGTYSDKVRITWNGVCNGPYYVTYYRVFRGSSVNDAKIPISEWQTSTGFEDRDARAGIRYTYWVRAATSSGGIGAGDYSAPEAGWRSYTIHVDDDAPGDPRPCTPAVSDPCENGTSAHPFDSIQEGIDAAPDGAIVFVHNGVYGETILLSGKNVTVTGFDPNGAGAPRPYPVIDANYTGTAVTFIGGEDTGCTLEGLAITRGAADVAGAIYCEHSSPTIKNCIITGNQATDPNIGSALCCISSHPVVINCTIAGNRGGRNAAGIILLSGAVVIKNSILWGNASREILSMRPDGPSITYSDIAGGWPGAGNLDDDPLFIGPGRWGDCGGPDEPSVPGCHGAAWVAGDYHLQSQAGRWDSKAHEWVQDEATSACIDAGDPTSAIDHEPSPNGGIVNMGAYGGTSQASLSREQATPPEGM
jgi:hypothetical protein